MTATKPGPDPDCACPVCRPDEFLADLSLRLMGMMKKLKAEDGTPFVVFNNPHAAAYILAGSMKMVAETFYAGGQGDAGNGFVRENLMPPPCDCDEQEDGEQQPHGPGGVPRPSTN